MAVTGAIFNSLSFGGINSADYGIYITGEGVFNAPKRAVNMVAVPGRNGSIAIDQGHWDNIEVTYPAGTFGMDEEEFRTALSDFRNAIASQVGYQRLTDTYHPDEYRMAIYSDGLEVEPTTYNKAGEFELKFNCKPQRWLTSGEIPVTIGEWGATKTASGEIVTIESEGGEAAKSLEVSLEPIQAGSGEPSPSNVRAISGRTSVETTRAGKNLLTYTETHRTISGVTIDISTDGTLHAYGTATAGLWVAVGEFEAKGGKTYFYGNLPRGMSTTTYFVTRYGSTGNTYEDSEYTFANDTNAVPRFYVRQGVTLDVTFKLVVADADTAQTYTTSLGRTVYGGTLDVVSGVLTVDRAMVDLGTLSWTYDGQSNRFYTIGISELVKRPSDNYEVADSVCSAYSVTSLNQFWSSTDGKYAISITGAVSIRDSKYADATSFKTAMDGVQLCYELATPQTYQLTPQQIELLLGENHVWSDGAITMQYGDDPNSLWNPTRYDAGPLLAIEGNGNISFNGYTIAVDAGYFGEVEALGKLQTETKNSKTYKVDTRRFNNGDDLIADVTWSWRLTANPERRRPGVTYPSAVSISNKVNSGVGESSVRGPGEGSSDATKSRYASGSTHVYGTFDSSQDTTLTNTFTFDTLFDDGVTVAVSIKTEIVYNATDKTITFKAPLYTFNPGGHWLGWDYKTMRSVDLTADSTMSYLGHPTYIDCELGEAYRYENGEIVSLNQYIELGSDLPTLSPGANDVTTDNTITELTVTPNWWKL